MFVEVDGEQKLREIKYVDEFGYNHPVHSDDELVFHNIQGECHIMKGPTK